MLGADYKICLLNDNEPSVILHELISDARKGVSLQFWRCQQFLRDETPGWRFTTIADDVVVHTIFLHSQGVLSDVECRLLLDGVLRLIET